MRSADKPTMACLFLHLAMRYSLEEAAVAVHAMEPWQIDELAPLGECANRGWCLIIDRETGRIGFISDPKYGRFGKGTYGTQEFIPAEELRNGEGATLAQATAQA